MGEGEREYWCFVPNAVDLLQKRDSREKAQEAQKGARSRLRASATARRAARAGRDLVIYYVVDDWTKFHNLDGEWMGGKERELLGRADVVFAASGVLEREMKERGRGDVHYVSHGVEYGKFAAALGSETVVPDDVAGLPKPVVGFYGNIHPWVDLGLVAELARRKPAWSFVLIGHPYVDVGALKALPNVHCLGRREHDELPAYCRAFDVAVIPYDMGQVRMESVNPVKTRELLAAGVPIVASDVPELRQFGDRVLIGRTIEEWVSALEKQIERSDRRAISESVKNDDWSARVRQIRDIVDAGRPAAPGIGEWPVFVPPEKAELRRGTQDD